MNKHNNIIIHVIIPLFFGSLIYILFRDQKLLMFDWFQSIGLNNFIYTLRENIFNNNLPRWLLYSFPDGIWTYSLTSFMIITWHKEKKKIKYFWLLLGPILGISTEIFQFFGMIPGTFDKIDFIFCIIASLIPFYLFRKYVKGEKHEINNNV